MLVHQGIGNKKFKLVSVTNLVKIPITVNDSKTRGWRDITVQHANHILFSRNIELNFDGKGYPSNAATEPKINAEHISGEKLTFLQTGI